MSASTDPRPILTRGARALASICAASLLGPLAAPYAQAQAQQQQQQRPQPQSQQQPPQTIPLGPNGMPANALPALGDPEAADFSVGTERKLGERIMREIRADPDYLDDPLLLEYVDSIWQPLVAEARQRGNIGPEIDQRFAWEAFLVRDPEVNAFALPGGYVGVNLGLIALTMNRDELAGVLAHELSHITQRHIARSIAASKRHSLASLAALAAGLLAASRAHSADAANAVIVGSQAAAAQGQLNFSRDMEREADRVGFAVMTGAGFAPAGMAEMFELLEKSSRLNDSGGFPYLRSHPLTNERIGEARARSSNAGPVPTRHLLEHTVAEARARVLMDPRVEALQRWQGATPRADASDVQRLAMAYQRGLASSRLRDWSRADAAFAQALALLRASPLEHTRAERAIVLTQVQSLLARDDAARAATTLQPYAAENSRPVLLLAAQIALATPADDAILKQRAADLQTWVALHPADAGAWEALGQLWDRLGQPLRSLRAAAEARVALGDLPGAIDRLHAAQQAARRGNADFIDASVVDARLRDIESQRKTQVAEEKASR